MNKLHKYAFSELYDISSGISSTKSQAGHGAPFVSFSTVFNNYFLPDELPDLMDTSVADQEKCSVKNGDILITRTSETVDELAMSCVVLKDYPQATFSGFVKRLRPKTTGIAYDKYMAFFLRSEYFRKVINAKTIMTLRASFNEDIFSFLDLYLPDYEEQVKIGDFLYNIEKRIQCNKKINDNLQRQLKLMYDYWFTQFDFPDENGKPYRSSGGAMVWCDELQREIPKGWKVSTLSDIAVLQAKSVMPQEGTAYNHYSIPAFDDTHSPAVEDGKAIASNKYVVHDNSVLVSKLNPQFKRIWLIIDSTDNAICSTEFLPVKATETGVYALYSLLNSDAFSVHLIQNASSSTGSRKRIDPDNCMSYKFPYDQKVFARFDKAIQPLLVKITGIPTETEALVALRDWLLPMLMNGQATISD